MSPTSPEDISPEVRALLRDHVDSFEKIEIVAAAYRRRDAVLTSDEVSAELRVQSDLIHAALEELSDSRICTRDGEGGYRLQPMPELAAAVDALVRVYESDRLRVLNVMTKFSFERIRGAASAFAKVFRRSPADNDKEK